MASHFSHLFWLLLFLAVRRSMYATNVISLASECRGKMNFCEMKTLFFCTDYTLFLFDRYNDAHAYQSRIKYYKVKSNPQMEYM